MSLEQAVELICVPDDPFVESGDKWMGFYWKDGKDQLFARSGQLPPTASSSAIPSMTGHPWTSFTLNMREPSVLEGPLDLARFFVTSLTFMRTMKKIDMMVDGIKVFEVEKSVKGKQKVHKTGMKTSSANGMMSVTGVDATGMIMTARVMKWLSGTLAYRLRAGWSLMLILYSHRVHSTTSTCTGSHHGQTR